MNKDHKFLEALKNRPDLSAREEFKEQLAQKLESIPLKTKRKESIKISGLVVFAAILILLIIPSDWQEIMNGKFLSGIEENDKVSYLTEKEAIAIAEKMAQSNEVTWVANFKEEYQMEIDYKNTEVGPIWIIEGEYPLGNKDVFYIDAITGELLMLKEAEAPKTFSHLEDLLEVTTYDILQQMLPEPSRIEDGERWKAIYYPVYKNPGAGINVRFGNQSAITSIDFIMQNIPIEQFPMLPANYEEMEYILGEPDDQQTVDCLDGGPKCNQYIYQKENGAFYVTCDGPKNIHFIRVERKMKQEDIIRWSGSTFINKNDGSEVIPGDVIEMKLGEIVEKVNKNNNQKLQDGQATQLNAGTMVY
jgi:hypothetical protein